MVKQFYLTNRKDPIMCYPSGQSGHKSNGNEEVLYILQSFRTVFFPSDNLMTWIPGESYLSAEMQLVYTAPVNSAGWFCVISKTLIEGSYPSAEMQLIYSTTPADWALQKMNSATQVQILDKATCISHIANYPWDKFES